MQCQGPLPTGGPVGGKAVHSLRDALGCDADACLDQPENKGLHILPQAVLSGREDQAVRERGQGLIRCIERRAERLGRVGITT